MRRADRAAGGALGADGAADAGSVKLLLADKAAGGALRAHGAAVAVVDANLAAVQQFLRDPLKGFAPCQVKVEEEGKREEDMEERGWRLKGSTLKRLQELTAQVTRLHHEMQDLEKQRSRHDGEQPSLEDSKMRLERLRRQRSTTPCSRGWCRRAPAVSMQKPSPNVLRESVQSRSTWR